jgi:hypothetical protein
MSDTHRCGRLARTLDGDAGQPPGSLLHATGRPAFPPTPWLPQPSARELLPRAQHVHEQPRDGRHGRTNHAKSASISTVFPCHHGGSARGCLRWGCLRTRYHRYGYHPYGCQHLRRPNGQLGPRSCRSRWYRLTSLIEDSERESHLAPSRDALQWTIFVCGRSGVKTVE